jgi:hypothetical protein
MLTQLFLFWRGEEVNLNTETKIEFDQRSGVERSLCQNGTKNLYEKQMMERINIL